MRRSPPPPVRSRGLVLPSAAAVVGSCHSMPSPARARATAMRSSTWWSEVSAEECCWEVRRSEVGALRTTSHARGLFDLSGVAARRRKRAVASLSSSFAANRVTTMGLRFGDRRICLSCSTAIRWWLHLLVLLRFDSAVAASTLSSSAAIWRWSHLLFVLRCFQRPPHLLVLLHRCRGLALW